MDEIAPFGHWLKGRRKDLRLTQEVLAARISCSGAMVRKIEAGERVASPQMADLLAEFFAVVPDERAAFSQFARGLLNKDAARHALWQTLHNARANQTNLVAPLTTLIGREQELERLTKLLRQDQPRLLTLTGPPGIGKTRLSLELGIAARDHFEDGVFFVGLATVSNPDLVVAAIAGALSIPATSGESPLAGLQGWFSDKHILLLLDNFEQVLDAAPLVLDLLGSCSRLKVLVTSREALHVYGEQQFPVPRLALADLEILPPLAALGRIAAVALFIARAKAVKPDFAISEENGSAIAAICRWLEGLPLAIELAATHIRLFSPQEMLTRLEYKLPLLTGGPRNLPARQRTLHAAIDWSYKLLNEAEQILFARLSIFVGGCTLAAAEAIGNAAGDITFAAQDVIESLLDKSLLTREEGVAGESRISMLEMLREYAVRRLEERGESAVMGRLHAGYYLALAEASKPELRGPDQVAWFRRIEQEQDNLRTALRWAEANLETTLSLRLALALWWFWNVRGNLNEASSWVERALVQGGLAPALRAEALNAAGQLAWARGDMRQADLYLEESLALYNIVADAVGEGRTLRIIANLARECGDYVRSRQYYEQSLVIIAGADDAVGMALLLVSMGENARCEQDYKAARSFYERGLQISRDLGAKQTVALCLANLGNVARHEGHAAQAKELLIESLRLQRELRERLVIAECLVGLGSIARSEMQSERAVRMLAAADQLLRSAGVRLNRINRQDNDDELAALCSLVEPLVFERLWAHGQVMTAEQVIEYALEAALST